MSTRTSVGTIELGDGSYVVTANATVSANVEDGNMLCYLADDSGDLTAGNAKGERESFGLTALATGTVDLDCEVDSEDGGTATDISITAVEVAAE